MSIRSVCLRLNRLSLIFLSLLTLPLFAQSSEWSKEDRAVWNKAVKRVVTTPPCCGACAVLRMDDAKKIYGYITHDDITSDGAELFERHKETILEAVKFFDQERYGAWTKLFLKKEEKK